MKKVSLSPTILRQKREQSGLSIEEVVHQLDARGFSISAKTLYGYESRVSVPKVNTFIALCDIYGISDVLGTFGNSSKVALAVQDAEWNVDLYHDFFHAPLLDKIYLLLEHGVPSFDGYENDLSKCFQDDGNAANFSRLYSIFRGLDESQQKTAFFSLEEISANHAPNLSQSEMKLIQHYRLLSQAHKNRVMGYVDCIVDENPAYSSRLSHEPDVQNHA